MHPSAASCPDGTTLLFMNISCPELPQQTRLRLIFVFLLSLSSCHFSHSSIGTEQRNGNWRGVLGLERIYLHYGWDPSVLSQEVNITAMDNGTPLEDFVRTTLHSCLPCSPVWSAERAQEGDTCFLVPQAKKCQFYVALTMRWTRDYGARGRESL